MKGAIFHLKQDVSSAFDAPLMCMETSTHWDFCLPPEPGIETVTSCNALVTKLHRSGWLC